MSSGGRKKGDINLKKYTRKKLLLWQKMRLHSCTKMRNIDTIKWVKYFLLDGLKKS